MSMEQRTRDPLETTQYRLFLVPEFENDKGVLIGKAHHSWSDGLAAMQFWFALSDHYDSESIVGMKPLPLGKKMFIWLTMPFNIIIESLRHVVQFKDRNPLKKKNQIITGVKNGWYSNDLNIAGIKKYCKEIGNCTVNDYSTTLLSTALYEYFHKNTPKDEKVAEHCGIAMPFSMREAPSDRKNIKLGNAVSTISHKLKLFKDFPQGLEHV